MEGVKILECSPEELPGVEGVERSDGGGGNWGGPPRPGDLWCCRSVASYNRVTLGKWTVGREGVGGGHMYRLSRRDNRTRGEGRAAASFMR
jgi:hypothetical protein